jgi:hypothetical protein
MMGPDAFMKVSQSISGRLNLPAHFKVTVHSKLRKLFEKADFQLFLWSFPLIPSLKADLQQDASNRAASIKKAPSQLTTSVAMVVMSDVLRGPPWGLSDAKCMSGSPTTPDCLWFRLRDRALAGSVTRITPCKRIGSRQTAEMGIRLFGHFLLGFYRSFVFKGTTIQTCLP